MKKMLIPEADYRLKSLEVIHKVSYCVSKIHAVNYVKLIRRACAIHTREAADQL